MSNIVTRIKYYGYILALAAALDMGIATIADRAQHPTLTETQVFSRIPQTFFWDFSL